MRKLILYIIMSLLTIITAFAQPTIYKTWIGTNFEYLELMEEGANFYGGLGYSESLEDCLLFIKGDSLSIRKSNRDYAYQILLLTEDSLILTPSNNRTSTLTQQKKTLVLIDKSKLYKDNLNFQGLNLLTSSRLSSTNIEIDSTGKIYYSHSQKVIGDDKHKIIYQGQLNRVQLKELIELLKNSEINRLPKRIGLMYPDVGCKTLIYFYNNTSKSVQYYYRILHFNKPLFSFLESITKEVDLKKVDNKKN